MYYDKLEKQKKFVLRERNISIFCIVVFSLVLLFWIVGSVFNLNCIFFAVLSLAMLLFGIKLLIRDARILKQISLVDENKAINKTNEIKLYRPKIKFVIMSEFRSYYSPTYVGITIIDCKKNKYYYFFDEKMRYSQEDINRIREKFYQELYIQCYDKTQIVKTIQKDPNFLRIKNGKLQK